MSKSRDQLQSGLLQGKLPGMKDWSLFYVEIASSQLHIYEGHDDLSKSRKHVRSLEISTGDTVGEDKTKKKDYRFYVNRTDGKYFFKCENVAEREEWISQLQRVVNKQEFQQLKDFITPTHNAFDPDDVFTSPISPKKFDVPLTPPLLHTKKRTPSSLPNRARSFAGRDKISAKDQPLPPIPGDTGSSGSSEDFNPRSSVFSTDSGIGPSVEGVFFRASHTGSSSVPSSSDGTFQRPSSRAASSKSHSDGGKFNVRAADVGEPQELDRYKWFWDCMSRHDCEKRLHDEGKVGTFVVRINANGHFVLSLWRNDAVHHHKIIEHGGIFRFDKAAVQAEGYSLVDLLDTYMKNCVDKSIGPFGGQLHLVYHEAWNPPEIKDMEEFGRNLKRRRDRRMVAPAAPQKFTTPAAPETTRPNSGGRAPERYTPIEMDAGTPSVKGRPTPRKLTTPAAPETTRPNSAGRAPERYTLVEMDAGTPSVKGRPKRGNVPEPEEQTGRRKPLPNPPVKPRKTYTNPDIPTVTLVQPPPANPHAQESGKFKALPPTPVEEEQEMKKPLAPAPVERRNLQAQPRGKPLPGLTNTKKQLADPPVMPRKTPTIPDIPKFKALPPTPVEEEEMKKPLAPAPAERRNLQAQPRGKPLPGLTDTKKQLAASTEAVQRKQQPPTLQKPKKQPVSTPTTRPKPANKLTVEPSTHHQPPAPQMSPPEQEEEPHYANWKEVSSQSSRLQDTGGPNSKPYQNVDYTEEPSQYMNMPTRRTEGGRKPPNQGASHASRQCTNGTSEQASVYQNVNFSRDVKRHGRGY